MHYEHYSGRIIGIRASMPESRDMVFRPASGGRLRMVIDASKLDSLVKASDHQGEPATLSAFSCERVTGGRAHWLRGSRASHFFQSLHLSRTRRERHR